MKYKGEVAVRQCVDNRILRWIQSTTVWGNCPSFTDALSSKYLKRFSNLWTEQLKKVPTRTGPCCAPSACNPC